MFFHACPHLDLAVGDSERRVETIMNVCQRALLQRIGPGKTLQVADDVEHALQPFNRFRQQFLRVGSISPVRTVQRIVRRAVTTRACILLQREAVRISRKPREVRGNISNRVVHAR